jgi:DNA-binding transcriptional LysR family regulator
VLPWDDLRHFLEFCRAGSYAAAARRLHVDETTVGRRIARLEAALGARLVGRSPDGIQLTAAGEAIRASTEEMERAAIDVERRAMGADRELRGRVRITAPEILGIHFVLPALEKLQKRHPQITFDLLPTIARLDLARAEADVGIRVVRPDQAGIVTRRLGGYAMAPYVRKGRRADAIVTFTDATRPRIRHLYERLPGAPIVLRASSSSALLEAVRAGLGAGDLPCFVADRDPLLVRVFEDEPPQQLELWLAVHADVHRTARVRAVVRGLTEAFARSAATLGGVR